MSKEGSRSSKQGRLTEVEEGYLVGRVQQATILDTRQNQTVVKQPRRRDSTLESIVSVIGYSSVQAEAVITLKAVHLDPFLEGAIRA
jgi:hypothetical protein